MMEAWRPMENVMSDIEILEYAFNGVEYSIAASTISIDGMLAATIADQAIMQMLCDND